MGQVDIKEVLDELDFSNSDGLVTQNSPQEEPLRKYIWEKIGRKLNLDAIYFHGNVPLVYFKEFQSKNDEELQKLHQALWNYNRGPLLITVMPNEIKVYNCYATPKRDDTKLRNPTPLKRTLLDTTEPLKIRQELSDFNRWQVQQGKFTANNKPLRRANRVDRQLLKNLQSLRENLIDDNVCDKICNNVANSLLGRAIFICYLSDKKIIDEDYFAEYDNASSFVDLLTKPLPVIYSLYDKISETFNGDLFPVTSEERKQVTPDHLRQVEHFLQGHNPKTGQLRLWPYNFEYIPIEFISAIYETFLGDKQKTNSAYYTPSSIVDFILNEMFPIDMDTHAIKILDPSCGSGIFLVEAYRRLVINRHYGSEEKPLEFQDLKRILTDSIYGIDIDVNAIDVAAFSCYLALLDFLDHPKLSNSNLKFPPLKATNLIAGDFFDTASPIAKLRFDLILGNPPWRSDLSKAAHHFITDHDFIVADNQIAQAFLWRASTLLARNGQACLLSPSKPLLFNQSDKSREFRKQFFACGRVKKIVDLSQFRQTLFAKANAPAAAIFFDKIRDNSAEIDHFTYAGPHPSLLSKTLDGVVIHGDEIKQVSRNYSDKYPYIWKLALWGTPRDFSLINKLSSSQYTTLEKICDKQDWLLSGGVTIAKKTHHKPQRNKLPFVPANKIHPFRITSNKTEQIGCEFFERPRPDKLFRGPLVLTRSITSNNRIAAVFMPDNALFKYTIVGISGSQKDADYLKVLCGCLNSSLILYYLFLTSSKWGIERGDILPIEYKAMPFPNPKEDLEWTRNMVSLVDQIQGDTFDKFHQNELDKLVFDKYGISQSEKHIVEDFINHKLSRIKTNRPHTSLTNNNIEEYAIAYQEVISASTRGQTVPTSIIYDSAAPLRVVSFQFSKTNKPVKTITYQPDQEFDRLLIDLEKVTNEQIADSFFLRRNLKIFHNDALHIIKPAERHHWTRTAGYNDADETIAEMLRISRIRTAHHNK